MIFIQSKKHANFFVMIDTIDIMLWLNSTYFEYNMVTYAYTAHTVY